ncbi:16S rRNA (adenine(1518)-N(6)/adenine(1519)-N(6))-dimethyltransferase RsmA [Alkalibacter rhizosphaerae]|uniref:Ribosomal RNA small subunit methyltransferase A n=1 Tax=Alkalibacter rhizosphaerae TaxID=2815577 RepID=A0A975AHL7_9FIRM|nr:16S rRNA (adenine(1518)-N(6)/adenine(1519)-N(6))-dimethyltransferase RsmA [Alkalibacter rhizosphaerae]QSX07615.1 16S rRNA (adenine(1518)-N(6)/adenine(1519)-N(6))-dimethyltransferase RsmA [Alkalibacter rhizosphaerae]
MERLTSPRVMEALLKKHGFTMNKRFGQNFLTDENIVRKIVDAAHIQPTDVVLEIGPGIGTMTRELCDRAQTVLAVEIDDKLIPILKETLADKDNCRLIHGDILELDMVEELKKIDASSFKVVANLPYYITTPIIMGLLEKDLPLESITVMIQKEVAQRITASPGGKDYGALTVACGYYTRSELAFIVPATVFYPRPKVDSAVIHLEVLSGERMGNKEKKAFFTVVKAAFGNRRKTLLNSLSNNLSLEKEEVRQLLQLAGVEEGRRAETLSFEEFHSLAMAYGQITWPRS